MFTSHIAVKLFCKDKEHICSEAYLIEKKDLV